METVEVPQEKKKQFWKTPAFFVVVTLIVGLAGGYGIGRATTPPEIVTATNTVTELKVNNVVPPICVSAMLALDELSDEQGRLNGYYEDLVHELTGTGNDSINSFRVDNFKTLISTSNTKMTDYLTERNAAVEGCNTWRDGN